MSPLNEQQQDLSKTIDKALAWIWSLDGDGATYEFIYTECSYPLPCNVFCNCLNALLDCFKSPWRVEHEGNRIFPVKLNIDFDYLKGI